MRHDNKTEGTNGTEATGYRVPGRVQSDVERILSGAARRLLSEELDGNAISATTGSNGSPLNGGPDQSSLLVKS